MLTFIKPILYLPYKKFFWWVGYVIDGYKPTKAQFEQMTHIAISFLRPYNSSGKVVMTPGWENLDEVVATCDLAHEAGLLIHTNFMMGFPFETKKTRDLTINFAMDLDSDMVSHINIISFLSLRLSDIEF